MLAFLATTFGGAVFVVGVISGIGPQNFNTISHAIRRNHEYAVATTCFVADSTLILLGAIGLQLTNSPRLLVGINVVGIAFLVYFLWAKIRSLNVPHNLKFSHEILDKRSAIIRALGLTWLNPLVFIDTVVVIGGASTHYLGWQNFAFILGALLGDFMWLFGLTLMARTFAAHLNRPRVWLVLDIATIVVVAYILIKMLSFLLL